MAPNECLGEITVFKKSDLPLTKRIALRSKPSLTSSALDRSTEPSLFAAE